MLHRLPEAHAESCAKKAKQQAQAHHQQEYRRIDAAKKRNPTSVHQHGFSAEKVGEEAKKRLQDTIKHMEQQRQRKSISNQDKAMVEKVQKQKKKKA